MEKEQQPDSIATVTIKPDYPPSEVYSSEPPPAYHRTQSSAVQVAKIIAVTVVLVSVVLGSFLLASAYVTANASCRQLEQELELLSEAADRFQQPLQPEALVQEPQHLKQASNIEEQNTNEIDKNDVSADNSENTDNQSSDSSPSSESVEEDKERKPIHFKLPLQLDFDDLAGALIEKNQKSRMNCVVEKKRAEQLVDHQPKTVKLPFGLNLTTDPRLERISGERMAIFCESGSGSVQEQQQPTPEENNDDDDEEETIMIQPVMIPIPQNYYPTHMAQQMRPVVEQPQQHPFHPMEAMRPPMPPASSQQSEMPPASILHHIAQQIITQKIMEAQKAREESRNEPENVRFHVPEGMASQRIPIPEEVLTRLNRLPNREVIVAVSEQEPEEVSQESENRISQEMNVAPQEIRMAPQQMQVVQQQRESAQEMNGRQTYGRALPVHIPFHMIQQEQEQEQQATPEQKPRPHYVQPRSVRSVDALLPKSQKRVKRCSCDCAC